MPSTSDTLSIIHLQQYLSDEDFRTVFKMSRESFRKLQAWKQLDLKKRADLF